EQRVRRPRTGGPGVAGGLRNHHGRPGQPRKVPRGTSAHGCRRQGRAGVKVINTTDTTYSRLLVRVSSSSSHVAGTDHYRRSCTLTTLKRSYSIDSEIINEF